MEKIFKLSEYVVFCIFLMFRTWNLDFDLRWGLHSHQKKNMIHPPKIDQKDCFSNNKVWIVISIVGMDSLTQDLYSRT